MRPVVLDDAVKARIKEVIAYAREHRTTLDQMKAIMADPKLCVGDRTEYEVMIQFGVRVVYSIEQHPGGWFHHVSISVNRPGKYIHPIVADEILALFGLGPCKTAATHWNDRIAVNLLYHYNEPN